MSNQKPLVVAVAGNPNAGKSTLINAIAGSRLHVDNWPGVTVEKKKRSLTWMAAASAWIDRIVLNRFLGIPIFAAAMWLLFKMTFDLSSPFGDWIDAMTIGPFKCWTVVILGSLNAPDWTVSLVNDGVIAGVGSVLVFAPVIFIMMFFITFMGEAATW